MGIVCWSNSLDLIIASAAIPLQRRGKLRILKRFAASRGGDSSDTGRLIVRQRPKVQPFELLVDQPTKGAAPRGRQKPSGHGGANKQGGALAFRVTPLGAFAVGSLLASSLALAWMLGRRSVLPERYDRRADTSAKIESLEDVYRVPPIPYTELRIDAPRVGRWADGPSAEEHIR